ncbi:hypothetical protein ACFWM7_34095 [Streptomyces sp. NPDC058375]|uniref:hypothetical protein n=1 Tax=Streptomyces sp. NPDC058375 TaxID=3346467 RepID=UPI00366758C7
MFQLEAVDRLGRHIEELADGYAEDFDVPLLSFLTEAFLSRGVQVTAAVGEGLDRDARRSHGAHPSMPDGKLEHGGAPWLYYGHPT